jgi:Mg/Co/Ni transporter MgtE
MPPAYLNIFGKKQEIIIKSLPDEKAAELLNALQPDDRTAFLGLLPGNAVKSIENSCSETRAETLKLLDILKDL